MAVYNLPKGLVVGASIVAQRILDRIYQHRALGMASEAVRGSCASRIYQI